MNIDVLTMILGIGFFVCFFSILISAIMDKNALAAISFFLMICFGVSWFAFILIGNNLSAKFIENRSTLIVNLNHLDEFTLDEQVDLLKKAQSYNELLETAKNCSDFMKPAYDEDFRESEYINLENIKFGVECEK